MLYSKRSIYIHSLITLARFYVDPIGMGGYGWQGVVLVLWAVFMQTSQRWLCCIIVTWAYPRRCATQCLPFLWECASLYSTTQGNDTTHRNPTTIQNTIGSTTTHVDGDFSACRVDIEYWRGAWRSSNWRLSQLATLQCADTWTLWLVGSSRQA